MTKVILESSPLRSLTKGATWESSGLVTVVLVALAFTGNPLQSVMISLVYFPIRVGCYFIHERLWKKIKWGHREHVVTSGPTAGKGRRPIRWTGENTP